MKLSRGAFVLATSNTDGHPGENRRVRAVYMGTPLFAVPALEALASAAEIVAVYTRPDAASRRGSELYPSPVKVAALDAGLDVRQPLTLRDEAEIQELRELAPDVIVVCAYGMILPREVLDIPQLGCVNLHASLLPRWRGAAPIQRAILAGDEVTGVCLMRMEEGLDTGPYCACRQVTVGDKDFDALSAELSKAGADLLVEHLPQLVCGECAWTPQEQEAATYAAKIEKHELRLDPVLTVADALARVRASSQAAPARASVAGRGVTVLAAVRSDRELSPGAVFSDAMGLHLGLSDGALQVIHLRPDGKQEMLADAWARGLRLTDDSDWSSVS